MNKIENIKPSDYDKIIGQLDDWWGGRAVTQMLPRLFINHFSNTSFVVREGEQIAGFIVGFLSQFDAQMAYVHFIGVHPEYRSKKVGSDLYAHFFKVVKDLGAKQVQCVTSPNNTNSMKFHTKLGFVPCAGSKVTKDNIHYSDDYDGPGENRVVFSIQI